MLVVRSTPIMVFDPAWYLPWGAWGLFISAPIYSAVRIILLITGIETVLIAWMSLNPSSAQQLSHSYNLLFTSRYAKVLCRVIARSATSRKLQVQHKPMNRKSDLFRLRSPAFIGRGVNAFAILDPITYRSSFAMVRAVCRGLNLRFRIDKA